MPDTKGNESSNKEAPKDSFSIAPPAITMPKGGSAIRGIGEKFTANPVTGTGSMSVPIATSPGRSGIGPQLVLSYDSGAGNGPFGLGRNLALPAITRKTDKGLPRYRDAEHSDVFLLSGAEDLVPVFEEHGSEWRSRLLEQRLNGRPYRVELFRPRVEGLFARIERAEYTTSVASNLAAALNAIPTGGLKLLVSVRHDFPAEWRALQAEGDGAHREIRIDASLFPYFVRGSFSITTVHTINIANGMAVDPPIFRGSTATATLEISGSMKYLFVSYSISRPIG